MNVMNKIMTIRLPKEDVEIIRQISVKSKKDKSTIVRELVEQGRIYFAIVQYNQGKISIEKAAETAGLAISDMMDLLVDLGIKNNIGLEDYLEGIKTAGKIL